MNAEEIFGAALELPAGEPRQKYLDQVCQSQPALRQEVESLLQAHQQAGSFLQQPLLSPAVNEQPGQSHDHLIGTQIGPYRLAQAIGQGGMGVVFVADQQEPVKRRVALKLIKPEYVSRGVLARFDAERQALAIMDHPNIARVIDGGTTEQGRPYFVMELVKGIPITEYCDRARMGTRQRLELMIPVCQAVQHAHQKGIIHRDLKPTNVLVAEYDGQPVPKVIDFGIAKAIDAPLTDLSIHTDFGAVVGTLEYMSPEQAGLNQLDIDTRSDVYSLGVLLYELLTGTTPINRAQMGDAAMLEALRMIRELEPDKPSTRISSTEQAPTIAANRSTEPVRLSGMFRGDLDWISMKALAKERLRRYQTAKDLADDLQRYLHQEPVTAGPPSLWYRLRKTAQRNRAGVAIGFVVVLAGLSLLASTLFNANRIKQESDRRLQALELLRKETEAKDLAFLQVAQERDAKTDALEAEQAARQRADQAMSRAVEALQTLTDETIDRLLDAQPGLTPANRDFLNRIVAQLNEFLQYDETNVAARVVQADSLNQIGLLKARLGDNDGAVVSYQQAIACWKPLVAEVKDKPDYRRGMADAHSNMANSLVELQRYEESEQAHLQAIEIHRQLAEEFPGNLDYQQNVANCRNSYGVMLKDLKRNPETMQQYEQAIQIYERILAVDPQRIKTLSEFAGVQNNYGLELFLAGQHEAAIQATRSVIGTRRELVKQLPDEPDEVRVLAMSMANLAMMERQVNPEVDQLPLIEEALELINQVVEQYPGVWIYRHSQTQLLNLLVDALSRQKKFDRVVPALQRRIELLAQLAKESPERLDLQRDWGNCYSQLGSNYSQLGDFPQCIAAYQRALEILTPIREKSPDRLAIQFLIVNSHSAIARSQIKLSQWELALEREDHLLQELQNVETDPARSEKYLELLTQAHQDRGWILYQLQRYREAETEFQHPVDAEKSLPLLQDWQLKRIRNLVELDWAEAQKLFEPFTPDQLTTGFANFLAARIAANLESRLESDAEREAMRLEALKFLEQAKSLKYFDTTAGKQALQSIPDLARLRETKEYQDWLQKTQLDLSPAQ